MTTQEGRQYFPYCLKCLIKHYLLAEGHLGEAIDRCAREYEAETTLLTSKGDDLELPKSEWMTKMRKYATLLNRTAELRKTVEQLYYVEEILVGKSLGKE